MGKFVVIAVVLSAFGPYVFGGFRTEQLVIYGLSLLLLPLVWPRLQFSSTAALTFATWLVYALAAILGAIAPSGYVSTFQRGPALAGVDNVAGPLAVMLLVWGTVRPAWPPDCSAPRRD